MNVLVYGLKLSGYAAARLLAGKGFFVYLLDDNLCLESEETKQLLDMGCKIIDNPSETFVLTLDMAVVSPSISKGNKVLQLCRKFNIEIISEMELGYRYLPSCNIIAVTGTNGKTTTTELIHHILRFNAMKSHLLGNGGVAVCGEVDDVKSSDNVVLEVSSFQLENIDIFKPHISAILNLTPDHLDRHGTMETYIAEKAKIFFNQQSNDFTVLNADDLNVSNLQYMIKSKVLFFSLRYKVIGCYLEKEKIMFFDGQNAIKIVDISQLPLVGQHNVQNVMCAVICVKLCGLSFDAIKQALGTFRPLPHRCQPCGELGNVRFINDSKATNIDSALPLLGFAKELTVAIVGGSDKGEDFTRLFSQLSPNVRCIFVGATANKLVQAATKCNYTYWQTALNMQQAVEEAYKMASISGGTITLSPCCASFDSYKNFEHRGQEFMRIVNELIDKNLN